MRVFGQHVDFRILLLGVVDWVILFASMHLAALLWFRGDIGLWQMELGSVVLESVIFATCVMTSLVAMGLYNRRLDQRTTAVLARILVGFLAGATAMAVLMFMLEDLRLGRATLGLSITVALPLLGLTRIFFVQALGRDR
ncbi:MAG TPA: hypothetical protein VKA18_02590, partial [Alphaproteobacteria bacterium]|nr:hypothetical protein [Alphaproteobacteria bacterium]